MTNPVPAVSNHTAEIPQPANERTALQTTMDHCLTMKAQQIKALIELYVNHEVDYEDAKGFDEMGPMIDALEVVMAETGVSYATAHRLLMLGFNTGVKISASIAAKAE